MTTEYVTPKQLADKKEYPLTRAMIYHLIHKDEAFKEKCVKKMGSAKNSKIWIDLEAFKEYIDKQQ